MKRLRSDSPTQIVDSIMAMDEGSRLLILAPVIKDRKGNHKNVFEELQMRALCVYEVNNETYEVSEVPDLDRYKMHTIGPWLTALSCATPRWGRSVMNQPVRIDRLSDSVETALRLGNGAIVTNVTVRISRLIPHV
ncbi:MAG: hypothetical protein R2867_13395 [Caldilineaceae bacterium]